jgi:hypothetical protein
VRLNGSENFGGVGSIVTGYLKIPERSGSDKKFLASPEGNAMLQNFAGT